ncbi:MAG: efflux RND transporter periplasmic adaptor subunit [Chloroflexi bacterium]|nr:efflux RND transporter periplasmic adaptor subunit [Chloroflexota bacterium]MDA8189229.1 efflux RND transporter periplasmic adaptor subunit [Dehalococcoidales bacterium]
MNNKRLIGILTGALLLSMQVSACTSNGPSNTGSTQPAAQAAVPVQVFEIKPGNIASSLSYTGDVKPKAQISLSTKSMGRIEGISVDVGSKVKAGEVIGHLDRASLEAQLRQAEAGLAVAKAKQAQLEAAPRDETLAQVDANLRAAQARLAQLKAGPTPEQLDEAETAVRVAKNQLYAVQAQADAMIGSKAVAFGQAVFTKDMKEAQSGTAYEQVKLAEARLAELKAGATKEQLDQAQAAVDAAQAQLDLAKNPFTKNDFDAAAAGVKQAQANIDLVNAQLAETNIVAPVDGVVSDRFLSVGALANPQVPILSIISSDLEVAVSIEEARAGQIHVGQPVSITVSAYPDSSFAGTISSVSPAVDPRTRTFTAKASIKDQEGKLKAGMFAKVSINLDAKQGVLAAPQQAVVKNGADNTVFVVADGKARQQKVELGISDGQNVEVKSGLSAGDKIVIGPADLKDGDGVIVKP